MWLSRIAGHLLILSDRPTWRTERTRLKVSLLPGANIRLGKAWRPSTVRALLVPSFVSKFHFRYDLKLDEIDMSLNKTPDNCSDWLSKTPDSSPSLLERSLNGPEVFLGHCQLLYPPQKGRHPVPDDTLNSFPEQGQSLDCFFFFPLS